jgi:hypothetical protein
LTGWALPEMLSHVLSLASMTTTAGLRRFLQFPKAGKFYLLNGPIPDSELVALFAHATAEQDKLNPLPSPSGSVIGPVGNPANVEYREVRQVSPTTFVNGLHVDATTSLLVRSYPRSPNLAPKSGLIEHVFGALVLVEFLVHPKASLPEQRYLYVHRENAIDPMKFNIAAYCDPIELAPFLEQFLAPIPSPSGRGQPRIEQMAMRYIASSQNEIRRKTVEAHDVEAATSSLGLHRTIAGSMILSRQAGKRKQAVALTPHKQSIRMGTARVAIDAIILWAATLATGFSKTKSIVNTSSDFIAQMAQPLTDLVDKVPSSILIEMHALNDAIIAFQHESGRSWTRDGKSPQGWNVDDMLESLSEPIALDPTPLDWNGNPIAMSPLPKEAYYRPASPIAGYLSTDLLKVKVSSRTCRISLPKGTGKFPALKKGSPAINVSEILNDEVCFRVVFDQGRALYCSEGAFRSSNIGLAITQLTHIFRGVPALSNVISEKGSFAGSSTKYSLDSSFHFIENDPLITDQTAILLCDDATDEWCDYLELDITQPRIRWLHAKVQKVETAASVKARKAAGKKNMAAVYGPVSLSSSLGATGLQEVIGQAMKNLAKLRVPSSDANFIARCDRLVNSNCTLGGATNIHRNRRPGRGKLTVAEVHGKFDSAATDPLAVLEVAIVVPNYKMSDFVNELNRIAGGTASQPTIQAFWLLSGFMHACLEVGAKPLVFMQA